MSTLLPIGRFSRLSGLSIGTLRHYHEVGLLTPATVDPDTGYRRYGADQLPVARAIRTLRRLDLSLDEIQRYLATGDVELLHEHRTRLEARIARLQRAHHFTRRLSEGDDRVMALEPTLDGVDHRQLGVDLFNHVWTLLEKESRTAAEDDELVNAAHGSAFHWSRAPEFRPENGARSAWQCSRVYATLGRGEPALHHARRCLGLCEEHGIGDWDLAFAYEALSRAHRVAGDAAEAERYKALAREAGDAIADPEDRELFDSDYATL